ncbi:MAG: CoA transferase [Firmicutes bacterium]|jgi:CoA:oxalate CoA-transferase|nr:CoA transferase [Bacillota bacterium]
MRPLENIRVLDFSAGMAGPLCTRNLRDFGAEVIKVEHQKDSDYTRDLLTESGRKSGYFTNFNIGKKSITLNYEEEMAWDILKRVIKDVDVILYDNDDENYQKLGINYEEVKKINKKLIYASISGFGESSKFEKIKSHENVIQSLAGAMDLTGFSGDLPTRVGASIGEAMTGLNVSLGILMAVVNSKKTGEGQEVKVSKLASLIAINEVAILTKDILGEVISRAGNTDVTLAPYDVYKSKDGYISIGVASEKAWINFCKTLNLVELMEDQRFVDNESRVNHYKELTDTLGKVMINYENEELESILLPAGVPCSAVLSIDKILKHPQIKDRLMVMEVVDSGSQFRIFGQPMKMDRTPAVIDINTSKKGEDNEDILKSIGYSDLEIENLKSKNII